MPYASWLFRHDQVATSFITAASSAFSERKRKRRKKREEETCQPMRTCLNY